MNKIVGSNYKNLSEQQAKALKILNERLRNKEKKLKRLHIEMAHLRNEERKKKKLKQRIDKAIELNNQIIKDTKGFYRPTSDTIYSGDCLIDIAEQNLKVLKDSDVNE